MQKLRVIAAPGHLVADDAAYRANVRFRYVGRSLVAAKVPNPEDLESRFPPREREYEDSNGNRYIRRALQKGSIVACDEITAKLAGVKFDPKLVEQIRRASGETIEPEKKARTTAPRAGKDGEA